MFSTIYFRFRNYRNTGVVFVSENTVPLSFPMKNYESESGAVFRRPFLTVFIPNPFRLKGHRGKENYARGYTGATELFRGMEVISKANLANIFKLPLSRFCHKSNNISTITKGKQFVDRLPPSFCSLHLHQTSQYHLLETNLMLSFGSEFRIPVTLNPFLLYLV